MHVAQQSSDTLLDTPSDSNVAACDDDTLSFEAGLRISTLPGTVA